MNDIMAHARDLAQRCCDEFTDPHDNWDPMLVMELDNGDLTTRTLVASTQADMAIEVRGTLLKTGARSTAMVAACWTSQPMEENVMPSKATNRKEHLMIFYMSREDIRVQMAPIARSNVLPPRLDGMFIEICDLGDFPVFGVLVDAIRRGYE